MDKTSPILVQETPPTNYELYDRTFWGENAEAEPIFKEVREIVTAFMNRHGPEDFNPRRMASHFLRAVYGEKPEDGYLAGYPSKIWNLIEPVMEKNSRYNREELQLVVANAIQVTISEVVLRWAVKKRAKKRGA